MTPKGRTADGRRRVRVPPLLSLLALTSALSLAWYVATTLGLTGIRYSVPWAANGAAGFALLSLALLLGAIGRIRAGRYAGNRRAATRLAVTVPARLDGMPCTVNDLSIGGARVSLPEAYAARLGEEASLSLLLPLHPVALRCVVRRRLGLPGLREFGLEFRPGQESQLAKLAVALFHPAVLGDVAAFESMGSPETAAVDTAADGVELDPEAVEPAAVEPALRVA